MSKQEIDGIIRKWLNGNEPVFKDVVEHYYYQLFAFAQQMTPSKEDAEELVMNAFLRLWQHKNRITYVSRPDEYLFGILRREIIGHARKRILATEPIENIELTALGTVDHPELFLSEIHTRYQKALDKLTERQRTVFLLSRDQDLTRQEIADKTGISINTVGNHMNAALKILREEMKEYPEAFLLVLLPFMGSLY
ncbi:sigma-70 family RNA polymerase sigma factor [Sphingobacterium phlebotomi]|uniref:Sigma-70 family RNA polymerase sigma factor n=1 Tax=Sphingobacterium phlebotomi TaxID=2605433 RepID=A0A5D4H8E7_9SPHI|nr:sigma-70 family RNA polymerase sigma factor [Sphingobacterium phlebotomi]TYR36958.1 sigma-70 family RNA polymerase sigma factor [Sphingobacterium phlebotomi]